MSPTEFSNEVLQVQHDLGMLREDISAGTLEAFNRMLQVLLRTYDIRLPALVKLERRK